MELLRDAQNCFVFCVLFLNIVLKISGMSYFEVMWFFREKVKRGYVSRK